MPKKDSPTKALATFTTELTFDDIPKTVVERIKLHVLETVGSGLFGSKTPWGRILVDFVLDNDRRQESTIWGAFF